MDSSAELPQTICAQIDDQNNPANVESELPKSRILEELEILPPGCMPNNGTDTEEKLNIDDLEFVDDVVSLDDQGTISGDDKYQRASVRLGDNLFTFLVQTRVRFVWIYS